MMLTRSPAPTPSANASPRSGFHTTFHYAPVPSPRQSPRVPAALSRRQSTTSSSPSAAPTTATTTTIASPSFSRPKRYVGVDAATQYSPMEPVDYATGLARPDIPLTATDQTELPPTPEPKPMGLRGEKLSTASQPTANSANSVSSSAAKTTGGGDPPSGSTSQAVSPTKRRNSQGPGDASVDSEDGGAPSAATLAKRPKPEVAPSKLLPQRYEFCAVEDIVVLISHMLGELIETNDALALKSGHLTRFHSRTPPGISVVDYLHRLAKHATLSPPLLLSMVYYIDRLCALYPEFTINTLTVHRFLITAATVAAKGLSDAFWNNSTYARVGGVRLAELKLLELEFLYRVDWKIVPNPEVLVAYYRGLVERCPGYTLEAEVEDVEEADEDEDDSDVVDDDDDDDDDEYDLGGEEEDGGGSENMAAATAAATATVDGRSGGGGGSR
ncbi:cyclin-domain-containing protein [Bombardia bombarda]|uniref:Cyclin-domain-containing protein n=1 Tax=Bombardia bombarda TaxID=252184 RepID=A0AA39XIY6_9PEZI|nr:cyclin-domain-containing protein [Bombardia bombarda]